MTTSTNLVDYIGQGTAAARPATPSLNPDTFGLYRATDTGQVSLWNGSAWIENILVGGGSSSTLTGVVSGGVPVWESGLTWRVSAATYYINGVLYTSAEDTITLTAADATHDRIDVIALDTSGNVVKIDGTAAASPSEPDIDQATQIKLTFVIVGATLTAPAGVTTEDIYKEDAEWTTSTSGSGFTKNSTNNPYAGTKDIEGTTVASGAYIQLQRGSSTALDTFSALSLFVRSKASWTSGRVLRLQFYLNGVAKGQAITLATGFWGFDSSITSGYQFVAIPLTQFVLPAGTLVNQLRITDSGGSIGFYIDNIILTSTATTVGGSGSSGITEAQGDARYTQRANNLSDVASASTARTNLGLGSIATQASSSVTITGGSVSGITDLAVADGGTGSSTASGARTNLGVGTAGTLASDTDGTLAANSDSNIATQKAVKTYVDAHAGANLGAIHVYDSKASGTAGGTSTVNQWVERWYNTTNVNSISGASIYTSTVTVTIASPGVFTWNAHGLSAGAVVVLTTTGALPTGLTAGTLYYVVSPAANTFQLSASVGGSAINTSGSQSGTHTATTGQITLPAGTYDFEAIAPTFASGSYSSAIRFMNATDATVITPGMTRFGTGEFVCVMQGWFVLAAQKNVSIQTMASASSVGNGLGADSALSGVNNHFADLKIKRMA